MQKLTNDPPPYPDPPPYRESQTVMMIPRLFSSDWNETKKILESQGLKVITPILTTQHLSDSDTGVKFLANIIEKSSKAGVHVVGSSVCAFLALKLASSYPNLVLAVLIASPVVYPWARFMHLKSLDENRASHHLPPSLNCSK